LSRTRDDIDHIGCLAYEKDNSNNIIYSFLSLVNDRETIMTLLSKRACRIIEFDSNNRPISPATKPHIMYLTNCFDPISGDTSLMKIKTNTLECFEIYQSSFRIQNLSLNEMKQDQDLYESELHTPQQAPMKDLVLESSDSSPIRVS
jgi:hypothetical protein